MKSIMEEASSISKAIEQAWNRAGKPAHFSVRIFEEAKKNLFGLTTQPAKIAIFFGGKAGAHTHASPENEHDAQRVPVTQKPNNEGQKRVLWSSDMIDSLAQYLKHIFQIMGLANMQFSTMPAGNIIKIKLSGSITGKEENDRALFSSLAYLLMTMVRQKYKRSLVHLRIVFLSK